jgi:hypothetical protein
MSQLAESDGQPRKSGGGAVHTLRRFETERFQEDGWQEPCESICSLINLNIVFILYQIDLMWICYSFLKRETAET